MKKANVKTRGRKRKFGILKFKKAAQGTAATEGAYRVVKGSSVPTTNSKEKIREAVKAAIY